MGEIVQLTEDSATLELLFQFMYPRRLPELKKVAFATVASLAEAAEKYEVYAAIFGCETLFRCTLYSLRQSRYIISPVNRSVLPEHVNEILTYAARHGHNGLIDEMTPLLLKKRLDEMAIYLPNDLFKRWVIFWLSSLVGADKSYF